MGRCAVLALSGLALVFGAAAAQAAEADTASSPAAAPASGGGRDVVVVVLHSDAPELGSDTVRAAIARELGVVAVDPSDPLAANAGSNVVVRLDSQAHELALTYADARHGTWTRVIAAPALVDVAATAALLIGSLARHEADEIVAPPADTRVGVAAPQSPPAEPAPRRAERPTPVLAARATLPAERVANAAFFYPLATNFDAPTLKSHLSFNLLYGHLGALEGFELGSVNGVAGDVRGLEVGLLANLGGGTLEGAQVAGLYNRAQRVSGLQIGGLFNTSPGSLEGGQAALIFNAAGAESEGLQATFGLNLAQSLDGLQVAGVSNLSGGTLRGAQFALGFNRAGDVAGAQVALVNVGKRVRGLQVGLVNVAEDVEGVPIGLVSVTRSGGVHPMIWAASDTYLNFALKFATRYTYTFVSAAIHPTEERTRFGPGFALGASVPLFPQLFAEIDVSGTHLFGDSRCCENAFFGAVARDRDWTLFKLRGSLRYQLLPHLGGFSGIGLTTRLAYPRDRFGDTVVRSDSLLAGFAGVEL